MFLVDISCMFGVIVSFFVLSKMCDYNYCIFFDCDVRIVLCYPVGEGEVLWL